MKLKLNIGDKAFAINTLNGTNPISIHEVTVTGIHIDKDGVTYDVLDEEEPLNWDMPTELIFKDLLETAKHYLKMKNEKNISGS